MKILNLFAGIGGNRKLWEDCEVTAVENNESIAAIYKQFYPNDTVIVGDAHQFLLDHYKEFEFIWSSTPCQTHSRTNYFLNARGVVRYPDMRLYQEILFLKHFYKGLFVVENVKGYYEPLIKPLQIGRHYFWTNFKVSKLKIDEVSIGKCCGKNQTQRRKTIEQVTTERYGIELAGMSVAKKQQAIRNMVNPELALHILNCAKDLFYVDTPTQNELF